MPTSIAGLPDALLIDSEVISLYSLVIVQSGGGSGLRDRGALESAVAQPVATFGGQDLYSALPSKAAALGHSLIKIIHLLMAISALVTPRWKHFFAQRIRIDASVDEQKKTIIDGRSGKVEAVSLRDCHNPATN